ncbi:MAG: hypothetical protein RIS29_2591 [Bacteroidota bacterium]
MFIASSMRQLTKNKYERMKKNVGTIDQIVRFSLAVVLVVLSLIGIISGWLEVVGLLLAVIFIITAFVRFCPLYYPFGFNSWEKKRNT